MCTSGADESDDAVGQEIVVLLLEEGVPRDEEVLLKVDVEQRLARVCVLSSFYEQVSEGHRAVLPSVLLRGRDRDGH
jgi:hypothetical protein